jgi:hypothetical protein
VFSSVLDLLRESLFTPLFTFCREASMKRTISKQAQSRTCSLIGIERLDDKVAQVTQADAPFITKAARTISSVGGLLRDV